MKKIMILGLLAIGLSSCSKETLDSAGRDIAKNVIKASKWNNVVKTVTTDGDKLVDTLVGNTQKEYLDFTNDGFAYIYDGEGKATSVSYDMPTSKSMNFDNVSYQIKESIIQSTMKFTLENVTDGKTTIIEFKRK